MYILRKHTVGLCDELWLMNLCRFCRLLKHLVVIHKVINFYKSVDTQIWIWKSNKFLITDTFFAGKQWIIYTVYQIHLLVHHRLTKEWQLCGRIWSLKHRKYWARLTVWCHCHTGMPCRNVLNIHLKICMLIYIIWSKSYCRKTISVIKSNVIYLSVYGEHLQKCLWPQLWLCLSEQEHPAAASGPREPANGTKPNTTESSKCMGFVWLQNRKLWLLKLNHILMKYTQWVTVGNR